MMLVSIGLGVKGPKSIQGNAGGGGGAGQAGQRDYSLERLRD